MLRPERNEIPELTRFVAKAALPDENVFMRMRDELGPIFEDEEFANLYPSIGQPAESPARLALVTVMQFVEDLGDLVAGLPQPPGLGRVFQPGAGRAIDHVRALRGASRHHRTRARPAA